ncbi:hypothetical protein A33M_3505 [Rhodovulum sp. PH10]|nr:hypothetical protein A33M_3505 [Rhodovulum sp. PH10]
MSARFAAARLVSVSARGTEAPAGSTRIGARCLDATHVGSRRFAPLSPTRSCLRVRLVRPVGVPGPRRARWGRAFGRRLRPQVTPAAADSQDDGTGGPRRALSRL